MNSQLGGVRRITKKELDVVVLDISRVLDRKCTEVIKDFKDTEQLQLNSHERALVRDYLLGYNVCIDLLEQYELKRLGISEVDLVVAYEWVLAGYAKDSKGMMESIKARVLRKVFHESAVDCKAYLSYVGSLEVGKDHLLVMSVDEKDSLGHILGMIDSTYDRLANYHYCVMIFEENVSWQVISKVAIFMECFRSESGFKLFNRSKGMKEDELKAFLNSLDYLCGDFTDAVRDFYQKVSYGYQYEDLFITKDGLRILVMQKIELDDTSKRCPVCFEVTTKGNSYTKMLYKSFECNNCRCAARSKSNRGKRFDLFSAKKNAYVLEGSVNNQVDTSVYKRFRKDIVEDSDRILEDIIRLYSWDDSRVFILGCGSFEIKDRVVKVASEVNVKSNIRFDDLPLVKLLDRVLATIKEEVVLPELEIFEYKSASIVKGDSIRVMLTSYLQDSDIVGVITSPPYYNVREYSQWTNLVCYLVEMLVGVKGIYNVLEVDGVCVYNIGDIVSQDNIYVTSKMSNRRLMLGFYSMLLFDLVGFTCSGNIIWDKGEVQSRRNSTSNHYPCYLRPINVYEHCLVFTKGVDLGIGTEFLTCGSVKKINSKGENILGHTAPYPKEVAKLILNLVQRKGCIVDPFLGSGTTAIAMLEELVRVIGFEVDDTYYRLCCNRIKSIDGD